MNTLQAPLGGESRLNGVSKDKKQSDYDLIHSRPHL